MAAAETSIGERIRFFRTENNMTIKDLAAAVGITSSMLSQIEHDKANPSLNTIRMLASTLNVPLFRLFMTDVKDSNPIVRQERRHIISKNDVEYELLTPDMDGEIEFCMLRLGRDKVSVEAPMSHSGEEVALVLEGAMELHLDGDTLRLEKGDSIRIWPHQKHNWTNVNDGESVLLFAVSPADF